jgi:alpha-glucosidase
MPRPTPARSRCFAVPGEVTRAVETPTGALLELGDARFRIDVIRADIARMTLARAGVFDEAPTPAACFEMPERSQFELTEDNETVTITTPELRLRVDKRTSSVDGERTDGTCLFESVRAPDGTGSGLRVLNDEFLVERRVDPSDSIYGLGEKTGPFERRGRDFVNWNLDVLAPRGLELNRLHELDTSLAPTSTDFDPYYATIPFFQHARRAGGRTRVAGFFVDNSYKSRFELAAEDRYRYHFSGGQYREYVFSGPDYARVLEAYTFVTGRPELPPLWSLGHHQCRWHDYTDAQLLAIAREYRLRGIPCDAIWLDIGYMDCFRVFSWHPERFPTPERTLDALRADGFRAVTIIDPGLKIDPGYAVFDEARRANLLCKTEGGAIYTGQVWPGQTAFPDFSIERARAFWAERVRDHLARGISGLWNDMNEPATGDVEPFAMRFDRDGQNHSHERLHNQYASLMAQATRDGQRLHAPDKRPFTLTRAGYAGIQRHAAQWLGDNRSLFEHLALSIPMALGLSVSGQPFVGADIPGFAGDATPELAARWFQAGALTPFCRCHNMMGSAAKYPWSFGPEIEAIARSALELRYRLLPYLYAAFVRASERGEPIQRPLLFDFPDDPHARGRDDQFLLGDALLVAPVVTAGARRRDVYLPPGTWFDWYDDSELEGARVHEIAAPLEHVPLFVRAGSVLPLLERAPATTAGFFPEILELHWFVSEPSALRESMIHEDDGESTAYQRGAYLRTTLTPKRAGSELVLSAVTSGQGFPEFRRSSLRVVLHGTRSGELLLDGRPLPLAGGSTTFENRGEPFNLRFSS